MREYVGLYEHAPQMKADGVSDYKQLAAFGDTVLAATYSEKNGFMFCTWKQNTGGKYSKMSTRGKSERYCENYVNGKE